MRRVKSAYIIISALATLSLALLAGCEDSTGPGEEELAGKYPAIEISTEDLCVVAAGKPTKCGYDFDLAAADPGGELHKTILIRNSGERPLWVKEIALTDYAAPDGATESSPAFRLELAPAYSDAVEANEKFHVAPLGQGDELVPEELAVRVTFTRPTDDLGRSAALVIRTDAFNAPEVRISVGTAMGFPRIQLNPEWVDFQTVGAGQTAQKQVNVFNTGAADLVLTGFVAAGSEYFSLGLHANEYDLGKETMAGITFDDPIVIPPGDKTFFHVRFMPESSDPATATLLLYSNDPDAEGGSEVKLTGNESVPCLAVNPETVNFGGKKYGELSVVPLELSSCGQAPVEVYGFHFAEGSSPDFGVDLDSLGQEVSESSPLVVPLNGTVQLLVTFTPDEINPLNQDGTVIFDEGILVITNNSFETEKEVAVLGVGTDKTCPTAVIKVAEGSEVIPQTELHLFGDESHSPYGAIVKWQWEVEAPVGNVEKFIPSASFPNPVFTANIAGVYTFYLTVFDEGGNPSCFPAEYEVVVIPDEAIHVELMWHTPGDPDETDTGPEAGADLDLHFKHPWAAGPDIDGDGSPDGWFDIPFDCFWFNAHPNWGSYDPAIDDDPGLDRDDTDGGGPENINLNIPENVTYCAGVHYWNDHGYGPSWATMRVYIYAQLVMELTDVKLVDKDMWDAMCIEWPSGKVTVVTNPGGSGYKITPKYSNPYFFNP